MHYVYRCGLLRDLRNNKGDYTEDTDLPQISFALAAPCFHSRLGGPGFITFFERLTLVVELFALAYRDADFYVTAPSQDFERHDGPSLLLCLEQPIDFAFPDKEFAGPRLVLLADGNAGAWTDGGINEIQFAVFECHVGASQLAVAHPQRLGLCPAESDAGDQPLAQFVIVAGAAVGDLFGLCLAFLGHNNAYCNGYCKLLTDMV
jgi:hypothetical protein